MINKELWNEIENFELDSPDSEYTFSERLCKENNWTYQFTLECIHEYKRFMYLATVSELPVSPSSYIDEVWHLHLIYSKSYWTELCNSILQKEIHHIPTRGGQNEQHKHRTIYDYTLNLYKKEFKTEAPLSIWENINTQTIQKINTKDFFLLPKKIFKWKK